METEKEILENETPAVVESPKKKGQKLANKDNPDDTIEVEVPKDTHPVLETEERPADAVFAKHPYLAEYYQTTDGQAFYTENAAVNHAKSLVHKNVKKIIQ